MSDGEEKENKPILLKPETIMQRLYDHLVLKRFHIRSSLCALRPRDKSSSQEVDSSCQDIPRVFIYRFPSSPSTHDMNIWLTKTCSVMGSWPPGIVPICADYLGYAEDWTTTCKKMYLSPIENKYGTSHHPLEKCNGRIVVDPKSGNIYGDIGGVVKGFILRIGTEENSSKVETKVLRTVHSSTNSRVYIRNLIQDSNGKLFGWTANKGVSILYSLHDDGKQLKVTEAFLWPVHRALWSSDNMVFSQNTNRFALLTPNTGGENNYCLFRQVESNRSECLILPWLTYEDKMENGYLIAHERNEMIICASTIEKRLQMEHISFPNRSSVVRHTMAKLKGVKGRFTVVKSSWIFWIEDDGETICSVPFPSLHRGARSLFE